MVKAIGLHPITVGSTPSRDIMNISLRLKLSLKYYQKRWGEFTNEELLALEKDIRSSGLDEKEAQLILDRIYFERSWLAS